MESTKEEVAQPAPEAQPAAADKEAPAQASAAAAEKVPARAGEPYDGRSRHVTHAARARPAGR